LSIDRISNFGRPLPSGQITKGEMGQIGLVWLSVSVIGSWCAGFYPFFINIVCIASSCIYSSPPLRFKRVPLLSSFLIGVAVLSTVMAGFFFVSVDKRIAAFPALVGLGIVAVFTLVTNIRDIKDVEGDRKEGVKTLPVLF